MHKWKLFPFCWIHWFLLFLDCNLRFHVFLYIYQFLELFLQLIESVNQLVVFLQHFFVVPDALGFVVVFHCVPFVDIRRQLVCFDFFYFNCGWVDTCNYFRVCWSWKIGRIEFLFVRLDKTFEEHVVFKKKFTFCFQFLYFQFEVFDLGRVEIFEFELLDKVNLGLFAFLLKEAPSFAEEFHLFFKVIKFELACFRISAGFFEGDFHFFGFFNESVILFVSLQDLEGKDLFWNSDFLVLLFQLFAIILKFVHSGGEFSHFIIN